MSVLHRAVRRDTCRSVLLIEGQNDAMGMNPPLKYLLIAVVAVTAQNGPPLQVLNQRMHVR